MDLDGSALVESEKPCHEDFDGFKEGGVVRDPLDDASGREGRKQEIGGDFKDILGDKQEK